MQTITTSKNTLNQKLLMEEIVQLVTQKKSPSKEARREIPRCDSFGDSFEGDFRRVANDDSYSDESDDLYASFDPSQPADFRAYAHPNGRSRYRKQCGILLGVLIVSFIALLAIVSSLP